MKENITIIIISAILVIAITFYLFNNANIMGYSVYETDSNLDSYAVSDTKDSINLSDSGIIITKDIALNALNESEKIIQELIYNNFSTTYANDTLIEARRVFEQARYADILRGITNATSQERLEAANSLKIVNWRDINYSIVIEYTNKINERLPVAFSIHDSLSVAKKNINDSRISENTKKIFEKARIAFYEDRYEEAKSLIEELKAAIEKDKSENSGIVGLRRNALNFFQRYWLFIIIVVIVFSIVGYFAYKKIEIKILKNKIKKMKAEKTALSQLVINNQTERFKENKISAFVYNIRSKKYKEKLQEIEQELPVLEARLRKDSKYQKNNVPPHTKVCGL